MTTGSFAPANCTLGPVRPSYACAKVEALEWSDGRLMIRVATTAPAAFGAPVDQPLDDENTPASYARPPRQAMPRKQVLWKARCNT